MRGRVVCVVDGDAVFPIVIPPMGIRIQDPEPIEPAEKPEEMTQAPDGETPAMDPTLEAYRSAVARTIPRPETWDDIIGNKRVVTLLREAVNAAKIQGLPLPHILLFGSPGMGKSTLAKMIARDMNSGCVETTASPLTSPTDVIRLIHQMNRSREKTLVPSVLFIDEIHGLGGSKGGIDQESIYPLLEDWIFYHNAQGKTLMLDSDGRQQQFRLTASTFNAWPFTCIGATTEPGILHQALLRRFLIQIELDPYTDTDIGEIIFRACRRMTTAIDEQAAEVMAGYCRRNPGRAFSLLAHAKNRMVTVKSDRITTDVVSETIERLNLFPLGLTETDVRVLEVLASRMPKGVGQAELSRAIGISLNQFSAIQEPYLRQMDFIATLNRRVITLRGLRYLAQVGRADMSRAEIRSALERAPS